MYSQAHMRAVHPSISWVFTLILLSVSSIWNRVGMFEWGWGCSNGEGMLTLRGCWNGVMVLKWRGDVEIGMKPEGIEIGVWLLNWVELLSEGEGVWNREWIFRWESWYWNRRLGVEMEVEVLTWRWGCCWVRELGWGISTIYMYWLIGVTSHHFLKGGMSWIFIF